MSTVIIRDESGTEDQLTSEFLKDFIISKQKTKKGWEINLMDKDGDIVTGWDYPFGQYTYESDAQAECDRDFKRLSDCQADYKGEKQ